MQIADLVLKIHFFSEVQIIELILKTMLTTLFENLSEYHYKSGTKM